MGNTQLPRVLNTPPAARTARFAPDFEGLDGDYLPPAGYDLEEDDLTPRTEPRTIRTVLYHVDPTAIYVGIRDHYARTVTKNAFSAQFPDAFRRTRVISSAPSNLPEDIDVVDSWSEVVQLTRRDARGMSRSSVRRTRVHAANIYPVLHSAEAFVGYVFKTDSARDDAIREATFRALQHPKPAMSFVDIDTENGPMVGVFLPNRQLYRSEDVHIVAPKITCGATRVNPRAAYRRAG